MRILILGAAGMLGRKLTGRLAADAAALGTPVVSELVAADVSTSPVITTPFALRTVTGDLADEDVADRLVADRPTVIFHLAAVVSGEAEADFAKGYRANLDGTRRLLEAVRRADYRPRFVFASSIAVFGGPFPDVIGDQFPPTPLTSYGTQKAIGELLVNDYTRRGFIDGVSIRLPTVCVRPGAPNRAASGFFSSILREPLAGREALLPVADDTRHWFCSPRVAVGFLLHAATLDTALLGDRRAVTMPGVSATVAEQINALRRVAGDDAVRLIRREPDVVISRIVAGWPHRFDARRALDAGFVADDGIDAILRVHIDDELGGRVAVSP
jgi:D-erythronate 2-dehydrogenase